MDIILDKPEQMLFALLRSALNSTKPVSEILFTDISPALWQACYKLACTQGVMALYRQLREPLPSLAEHVDVQGSGQEHYPLQSHSQDRV